MRTGGRLLHSYRITFKILQQTTDTTVVSPQPHAFICLQQQMAIKLASNGTSRPQEHDAEAGHRKIKCLADVVMLPRVCRWRGSSKGGAVDVAVHQWDERAGAAYSQAWRLMYGEHTVSQSGSRRPVLMKQHTPLTSNNMMSHLILFDTGSRKDTVRL